MKPDSARKPTLSAADLDGPATLIAPVPPMPDEADPFAISSGNRVEQQLGQILVNQGRLSPREVKQISDEQRLTGQRFGEIAIRLGLLTKHDLVEALYTQYDYPFVPRKERTVSTRVSMAFHPEGGFARSIRTLRSQLMTSWFKPRSPHNVLSLSGVARHEGRSYVAANLAVAFAQLGERTLLIDADLRHPAQHRYFKLHGRLGLAGLLAGRGDISEITRLKHIPQLAVLPAGATPPNPQELLARRRFTELIEDLSQNFDVILVDTAAAESEADALVVAERTRGACLVARRNATPLNELASFRDRLTKAGVEIVGVVFNEY